MTLAASIRNLQNTGLTTTNPAHDGSSIHYVNLGSATLGDGLDAVLEAILHEVERTSPSLVVVDSFRTIMRAAAAVAAACAVRTVRLEVEVGIQLGSLINLTLP